MIRPSPSAALLGLALILAPAGVHAAAPTIDNLLQNSPFGGPGATGAGARSDAPLEFRGVLVEGGESYFSIYEAATHSSLWVGVNEPGNPYKVQAYDAVKGVVTVEYKGGLVTLPLKQAKVLVLAPTAPPPATGPSPAGGPVGPGNVTTTNPAGDPVKMMEEIRRRRALRQQAVQPGGPGGPVPTPGPMQNPPPALPIPERK